MFIKRLDDVLLKEYRLADAVGLGGQAVITAVAAAAGAIFVVDDGKLSDISSDLVDAANKLSVFNTQIYSLITSLGSYWEGPSYDAFVQKANSYKKELEELPALFSSVSGRVGGYSSNASDLYNLFVSELECGGAAAAAGAAGASLPFLYSLDTKTQYDMPYKMNAYSQYESNKDVLNHAKEIQSNLYNDLEILQSELISIEGDIAAIEKMYPNENHPMRKEYLERLEAQRDNVSSELYLYTEALNKINPLLEDKFFGYNSDGNFVEAADWGGNFEGDEQLVKEGITIVNSALRTLDPVYAYCERSSVNGLAVGTGDNDYALASFYNGCKVSDVVMEASYASSFSKNNGVHTDGSVSYFNSRGNVEDGIMDAGYLPIGGTHTFSELDAYGYDGCVYQDSSGNSYDSVRVETDDGPVYMTYHQYQMSDYYQDETE